jgi:4-hydroxy-tetrahydrodipicolinate synthase
MAEFSIRGVIPCLVIPFDRGGGLLPGPLEDEVRFLDRAGVHALCVGGIASEMAGSTPEEFARICSVVTAAATRPVIAAIYPDSTAEAIALARSAVSGGASALLVAQPHYLFQPDSNGLKELFRVLRDQIAVPIMLSNTIPTAAVDLARIRLLAAEKLIDGVHQGATDAHLMADLLCQTPRLPVLAGIDDLMYVALLLGAEGVVSSLAALFPAECVALYDAIALSEYDSARTIHERLIRIWRALDHPAEFIARLKYMSNVLGRAAGVARSPYDLLSEESQSQLRRALQAEGVL